MATIVTGSCSQAWAGDYISLTVAVSGTGTTLDLLIQGNALYTQQTISNVSYSNIGSYKYFAIGGLFPSSYITIQVRLDGGAWSSPVTFYILDNTEYATEYSPSYIPPITSQDVWDRYVNNWEGEAACCVANALATMKNVQEYKQGGTLYREYSIGWIYGNRTSTQSQTEGMMYEEALAQLVADGVPYYKRLPENANYKNSNYYYPDVYYYTKSSPTGVTAKQLVANNYNNVINYARIQRIASYSSYTSLLVKPIKQQIINTGCALITLDLYANCYPLSTGIFPEYKSGNFVDGHMMVILGWKKINQVNYWICAGSWGSDTGDNGLYYVPFFLDYGHQFYFVTDGSYTGSAPAVPSSPTLNTNQGANGRGEGALYLNWGSSSGALSYTLRYKHYSGVYSYVSGLTGTSYTLTGLEYGVSYSLSVCAINEYGSSAYSSENTATTTAKSPGNLTSPAYTKDTIDIRIADGMDGNWDYIRVYAYNNSVSPAYQDISKAQYDAGTRVVTWTNLGAGLTYKFNARTYYTYNSTALDSVYWSNDLYVTTEARPNNFSWTNTKTAGGNFNLTAAEWNSFTARINDFRAYKGISSYSFTNAVAGNNFTAVMFNQARNAIADINTLGLPSTKNAEDLIYASYLNDLVSCLNAIS